MADQSSGLRLVLYQKKKKANFTFNLNGVRQSFTRDCINLRIRKNERLLFINNTDTRGMSVADIKATFNAIPEGSQVGLVIWSVGGNSDFLSKQKFPRFDPKEIYGLCEECPSETQVKKYKKSVDWFLHVKSKDPNVHLPANPPTEAPIVEG